MDSHPKEYRTGMTLPIFGWGGSVDEIRIHKLNMNHPGPGYFEQKDYQPFLDIVSRNT